MQNAPRDFGALETHSQLRYLGIVRMRSGMTICIRQEFVFIEARLVGVHRQPINVNETAAKSPVLAAEG